MAVEELKAVEALQWAPSGNGLEGVIAEPIYFLAGLDGKTKGYGWGPGWSVIFYQDQGDISVEPRDWLVRLSNGLVVVEKEYPAGAKLFDFDKKKALIEQHRLFSAAIQAEEEAAAEERYWSEDDGPWGRD